MSDESYPPIREYRPADYRLGAMKNKRTPEESKGNVGLAWINEDGTVKIKLNPFVVVTHDMHLMLFPIDRHDRTD